MRWFLSITMALGFTLVAAAPALAEAPPYYPPIEWMAASRSNYDLGRWAPISAIVIHETDGPWTSAVNWFRNPRSRVSAHYIVRAWDGGIVQTVAESDTAYHARNANPWSIGIELEYSVRYGIPHTDAQYRSAAQLACAIARRYGIPLDRAHIVGHNELPDSNHGDPGRTWNWNHYMSLVRGCSVQRAQAVARSLRTVGDHGFVPAADLRFEDVSDEVALLQWNLTYLGFMDADEVSGGGSRFGPLTQAAVTAFQESSGVAATGVYDEVTSAALVHAVTAEPADVPAKDLDVEAESDDVAKLQTALQQLGYMDLVTGYYGSITMEALANFQQDNGIEPTGAYGAITRMALAFRTKPSVASEESPPVEFAIGGLGFLEVFLIP
jgi:N-acetyl-anhydromuramyl-L-alanine amidase AmpD